MLSFYSNITFQLYFPSGFLSNTIDDLDEGVEFSLQFGSQRNWIPITLTILSRNDRNNDISIGTDYAEGNVLIREYLPELKVASRGANTQHSVTICNFEDSVDSVQFRWLQTCTFYTGLGLGIIKRDAWNLDNVLITYQDGKDGSFVLFDGSK